MSSEKNFEHSNKKLLEKQKKPTSNIDFGHVVFKWFYMHSLEEYRRREISLGPKYSDVGNHNHHLEGTNARA